MLYVVFHIQRFIKFGKKKNPTFTSKDIENCSELLKEYSQSLGFIEPKLIMRLK